MDSEAYTYCLENISITSLGCKVNQAECAWLEERLRGPAKAQHTPGGGALLLTCAVTATASRQSRQMARRLLRDKQMLLVSGCDAQINPELYHALGAKVLPRANLAYLPSLEKIHFWDITRPMPQPESGPWLPGWRKPGRHTRGQLKVQDGCNAHCAYCIVPKTRGGSRSLELDKAVASFVELAYAGAREVVLSGIHLGRYDDNGRTLLELVSALLASHPGPRIRLSSLEANEVSSQLIQLMAGEPRLCPHLHLPLQSGSDEVLRAMGRTYKAKEYAEIAWAAHARIENLCLGADVMVGLPGEDEAAFEQTLTLLQELPIAYLHVFPFSPRPGTKAEQLPGRPPSVVARHRAGILRSLGDAKWKQFLLKQVGRKLRVLAEDGASGRADNYCPVHFAGKCVRGQMVEVHITNLSGESALQLQGEIIS